MKRLKDELGIRASTTPLLHCIIPYTLLLYCALLLASECPIVLLIDREIRKNWPSAHKPAVAMPDNGMRVKLQFNKPFEAEIVGRAAVELLLGLEHKKATGESLPVSLSPSTLLVTEEFSSRVLLPADLPQYTPCRMGQLAHKVLVPLPQGFDAVQLSLEQLRVCIEEIFDEVAVERSGDVTTLIVQGIVSVQAVASGGAEVSWTAGPVADLIADGKPALIDYCVYMLIHCL